MDSKESNPYPSHQVAYDWKAKHVNRWGEYTLQSLSEIFNYSIFKILKTMKFWLYEEKKIQLINFDININLILTKYKFLNQNKENKILPKAKTWKSEKNNKYTHKIKH